MSSIRSQVTSERGQAIFIMPIAFLIVVILGAATLEAGNLYLRQRQLEDLADSIASDAAGFGFDEAEFRQSGTITIDEAVAGSIVGSSIGISNLPSASGGVSVVPGTPDIEVTLTYTHDFILGRQIFGATQELRATGNATLVPS